MRMFLKGWAGVISANKVGMKELDPMILVGPLQLTVFCGSVTCPAFRNLRAFEAFRLAEKHFRAVRRE